VSKLRGGLKWILAGIGSRGLIVFGMMMTDIADLKKKYIALYGAEGCTAEELLRIEAALDVQLPDDFKMISELYSGGFLGGISHHEIATHGEATNIVQETLRIRKAIGLNKALVVLAEPSGSLVVLDVRGGVICYLVRCCRGG
jgi:hypothetical protein